MADLVAVAGNWATVAGKRREGDLLICLCDARPAAPIMPHAHATRQMRTVREAGQLLLASRLGGVLPGLARIRSIIVAVRKTSGAVTEPRQTAISGAPGLAWISVPGSGGGGLKRSVLVM
jgi:hypothetical protein